MNAPLFARKLLLGLTFAVTGCASNQNDMLRFLENSSEATLLIYPERILTRSAIQPEQLEKRFKKKMSFTATEVGAWFRFQQALSKTKWVEKVGTGDFRWGLHIVDEFGRRTVIYIDRLSGCALVNGKAMCVTGDLLGWLSKQDRE